MEKVKDFSFIWKGPYYSDIFNQIQGYPPPLVNMPDMPNVCFSFVLLFTIFIIVVPQKLFLQQSKNVTEKCTETLSPPPSIQYLLGTWILRNQLWNPSYNKKLEYFYMVCKYWFFSSFTFYWDESYCYRPTMSSTWHGSLGRFGNLKSNKQIFTKKI